MEQNEYNITIEKIKDRITSRLSMEVRDGRTEERYILQEETENDTDKVKIENGLNELGEIELIRVNNKKDKHHRIWKKLIEEYHYLEHGKLYGLQIRYLIKSKIFGWIGAISYSSPAWRIQAREEWIGWNEENRIKKLNMIICNSRFLIVPQVKVKNLASHVLSLSMRRIKKDWLEQYGIEPLLVETFVEKERFSGTCYQAANFFHIGATRGRGRQDCKNEYALPVKDIYLYPLNRDARKLLCEGQTPKPIEEEKEMDWVEEEFMEAKFGDERLKNRLMEIMRDFYKKPQSNIPQACESRARTKAAYRFFDNKESTMENILFSHYEATKDRIKKEEVILMVQDSTSLNYSAHLAAEGFGPIGSKREGLTGLMVHDTMAFNLGGLPLGLINVQCWARDIKEYGKKHWSRKLPIEERESNKWLTSFQAAAEVQKSCPDNLIVSVGDREADIYELFELALRNENNPKLLIRAEHNREVRNEQGRLWEYMERCCVSGTQQIRVPRRGNQAARDAELTVRYSQVILQSPSGKAARQDIKVWAILAKEENAPALVTPVEWMILTTLEVNTFEEAAEKLNWYSKRWGIEVYHKTLKSGCQIEERQLGKAERIEACLAIDMVIAWRIYHLTKLGREIPDVPCTVFFEEAEWKALVSYKTKNPISPSKPPSLREAVRMVASLGGFLGRKGDGEPGTKTLWLGLERLDDITTMWKIFGIKTPPCSLSPPGLVQ